MRTGSECLTKKRVILRVARELDEQLIVSLVVESGVVFVNEGERGGE